MQDGFEISVNSETTGEDQRLTLDLIEHLSVIDPSITIQRTKNSEGTMDLGATISVIAGSAALTAIGTGLKIWLSRHRTAKVDISSSGDVKASGLTSKDAVEIARIFGRE